MKGIYFVTVAFILFSQSETVHAAFNNAAFQSRLDDSSKLLRLTPLQSGELSVPILSLAKKNSAAPAMAISQEARLKLIDINRESYKQVMNECVASAGVLQSRLHKQTNVAEVISISGAVIGVIGAIATCPHCAALASGLAGLANPLQQTFKDNGDTPADTQTVLKELANTVKSESDAYNKLDPALITEPDEAFEKHVRAQENALISLGARCNIYFQISNQVGETPATSSPVPAASPTK